MDVDFYAAINMQKDGDSLRAITLAKMQGTIGIGSGGSNFRRFLFTPSGRAEMGQHDHTAQVRRMLRAFRLTEVNRDNAATILPNLNLPSDIKDRMADAANAGINVITPQSVTQQGNYPRRRFHRRRPARQVQRLIKLPADLAARNRPTNRCGTR